MGLDLQFLGCGDAFGSGGRFNTCFHLTGAGTSLLIDCGASALVSMKRFGVDPNGIDAVLLTHFHADHAGGVPFFLLDAQFVSRRSRPLLLAGPPGVKEWLSRAMDIAFPGSGGNRTKFELAIEEIRPGAPARVAGAIVLAFEVEHGAAIAPVYAYRVELAGRIVTYTADTQWTDALIEAGRAADLLIAEAYYRDKAVPFHLDLATLLEKLPLIGPKRTILTHMSEDMLDAGDLCGCEAAHDGLKVGL